MKNRHVLKFLFTRYLKTYLMLLGDIKVLRVDHQTLEESGLDFFSDVIELLRRVANHCVSFIVQLSEFSPMTFRVSPLGFSVQSLSFTYLPFQKSCYQWWI